MIIGVEPKKVLNKQRLKNIRQVEKDRRKRKREERRRINMVKFKKGGGKC